MRPSNALTHGVHFRTDALPSSVAVRPSAAGAHSPPPSSPSACSTKRRHAVEMQPLEDDASNRSGAICSRRSGLDRECSASSDSRCDSMKSIVRSSSKVRSTVESPTTMHTLRPSARPHSTFASPVSRAWARTSRTCGEPSCGPRDMKHIRPLSCSAFCQKVSARTWPARSRLRLIFKCVLTCRRMMRVDGRTRRPDDVQRQRRLLDPAWQTPGKATAGDAAGAGRRAWCPSRGFIPRRHVYDVYCRARR